MTLCKHCHAHPITGNQKSYCSDLCYRDAKRVRERCRKAVSKPRGRVINCLGPCGRPFESLDPVYNRLCPRCSLRIGHMVPINGVMA
mgnify:CR=1 FL=1